MPNVWFIRHGECTANVGGATRTADEAGLTKRGWQQAQSVADYLLDTSIGELTRIISSHYKRALQTAEPTHINFTNVRFITSLEVHEFDYLALPRSSLTTSKERSSLVQNFWTLCSPEYRHLEQGESFTDFIKRVQRVLNELQNYKRDQLIVVFSHYQFIQAVRWLLLPDKEIRANHLQPGEMNDFYKFLKDASMPNGAILKTTLCQEASYAATNIETAHLTSSVPVEV